MRRLVVAWSVLGILVVAAGMAAADGKGRGRGKGLFRDPDGAFARADTNKDGKLSKEEFKNYFAKLGRGRLKDKPQLMEHVFDRHDTDGDGYLSREEFRAFVNKLQKHFKDRQKGKGKKGGGQ